MRLPKEKVDELLKRLDEVEFERNNAQLALLKKWKAEIEQYANDSVADDEKKLKAEYERLRAEVEAQSQKKKDDVTERNKQLMENSLREMENRQVRTLRT